MADVCIVGVDQAPVKENWESSLRDLATGTALRAVENANATRVDALFVGNMLAGQMSEQSHLGALVADQCGWAGIEAWTTEAACSSGAISVRAAYLAVASGEAEVAIAVGVEKMTDMVAHRKVTSALATAADAEYEVVHGASFVALNALAMQRYMHEYQVEGDAFAGFAVNAHANALRNPNAMFHIQVTREKYLASPFIAPPIRLLDSSPICDGAAAVVLCKADRIGEVCKPNAPPVRIVGSAVAVDRLSLHDRADILDLRAARRASEKAYRMAGVTPEDIDFFEAHDAFSIMAALSLEAAGFAERGQGVRMSSDGSMLDGKIPISTMGGLKARGHPVGASGVYQIVEATLQLQGLAGECQIEGAQRGMTQSIGGTGATAVTHILERM